MNVQASVVPMLFAAAGAWRKIKKEEPAKLDRPMRCALSVCFFAELTSRMEGVVTQTENVERLSKLGWVSSGPPVAWHFLRWDPTSQKQVVDTGKTPMAREMKGSNFLPPADRPAWGFGGGVSRVPSEAVSQCGHEPDGGPAQGGQAGEIDTGKRHC